MWSALQHDWIGFLGFLEERFPITLAGDAPKFSDGPSGLCSHIAQRSDTTEAEVKEILEALILPLWLGRRLDTAAE